MLLAIHGAVVGALVLLGIIFLKGKGSFLIAGYNTASKAEKEKIDDKEAVHVCGYADVCPGRLLLYRDAERYIP